LGIDKERDMGAARVIHILSEAGSMEPMEPNEIVEDYLDHLCGPLIGIVPYGRRERLRAEARYNIFERAALFERDGVSPQEAAERAVEKYGKSDELSEAFI
jgi:hypothetical protein